ncbi:hypothetical protein CKQ84_08220 [Shewanella sp. WE21]|uniref:hypothetical protein n=1 Tax=Shewanella sp. WE21 TaxID=2029986 RepID=UPI000CF5ED7B|nr:hypothetical protein [Shewanella sp. WE21]AVI65866.1 hypothetical protein CKQ84_08220 [Shewanella sp. WE21]
MKKSIVFSALLAFSSFSQSAEITYDLLHASGNTYVISNYSERDIVNFSYKNILSDHNNKLPKKMMCLVSGYRDMLPKFKVINNKDFSLKKLEYNETSKVITFNLSRNQKKASGTTFKTTTTIDGGYKDRAIHCVVSY